jgi:hypothetical protein
MADQMHRNVVVIGLKEAQQLLTDLDNPNFEGYVAGTKEEAETLMKMIVDEVKLEYVKGYSRSRGYPRGVNDRGVPTTSPRLAESFNVSSIGDNKFAITTEAGQVYKWLDSGTPARIWRLSGRWKQVRNSRRKSDQWDKDYYGRNPEAKKGPHRSALYFLSAHGMWVRAKAVSGITASHLTQRMVDYYKETMGTGPLNKRISRRIHNTQPGGSNLGR